MSSHKIKWTKVLRLVELERKEELVTWQGVYVGMAARALKLKDINPEQTEAYVEKLLDVEIKVVELREQVNSLTAIKERFAA